MKKYLLSLVELINEPAEYPEFGVSMLSRKVAMSEPILSKELKAVKNMSFNDFVKSIHTKKATELLMKQDLTIS